MSCPLPCNSAKESGLMPERRWRLSVFWVTRNWSLPSRWSSKRDRWDALGATSPGGTRHLGAGTSACESDDVLGPGNPPGDLPHVVLEGLFAAHNIRHIAASLLLLPAAFGFVTLHLPQAGRFHPAGLDQFAHLEAVDLRPFAPRPARCESEQPMLVVEP